MGTKTLPQLPVAGAIAQTDILHISQGGVDAQVSSDALSAYVQRSSRYAPIEVTTSGALTISISPTIQNQIVVATVAASNYIITFPAGPTSAAANMRVLVMRQGATVGILSVTGLNNFGGTIRLFNDQDCAVVEVVQTGPSTYSWEVTSVLTTGNYAPSGSSFTVQPGDMIRMFDITTGASNFVLTLSAGSSAPLGEYIVAKVDSGAGFVAITPNSGDAIGPLAANTVFYITGPGDTLHLKSNGVTGYNIVSDFADGTLEKYTVEGGFSVAAGSVVEILADGNIKQFRRYSAAPLDLSLTFQTQRVKIVPLTQNANGSGTAVAFYETSASVITAVVLSVTADLVVTAGTPVAVASSLTAQSHIMDAVALSATLVIFVYQTNVGYVQTVANTVSISGTVITLNTAVNNPDATTTGSVLQFISSTSVLWMGLKLNTTYFNSARVLTLVGSTITWNAASDGNSLGTAAPIQGYPTGIMNKAGSQSYYFWSTNSAGAFQGYAHFWISGTTTTFKSGGFVSGIGIGFLGACYPSRSGAFALAAYTGLSPFVKAVPFQIPEVQMANPLFPGSVAGSFDGATQFPWIGNVGAPSAIVPGNAGIDRIADDAMIVGGVFVSTTPAYPVIGFSPVFHLCEAGPFRIDRIQEAYLPDTTHLISGAWVGRLTDDIAICAWGSSTDLYFGALRRRRRVAGIAVDASGTIMRRGILWGQSGLTPGVRYYMSDTGTITASPTDLQIGTALTANTLEVDIKQAA